MPGKASTARYRAMLEDVEKRVSYAFYIGNHKNPYSPEDKRFPRFQKEMNRILIIDANFRDIHEAYGGDPNDLQKRKVNNPGPVKPIGL